MAEYTYEARIDTTGWEAISYGHERSAAWLQEAALCLWNDGESGRIVKVKEVFCHPRMGGGVQATIPGPGTAVTYSEVSCKNFWYLCRISAYTSISGATDTVTAHKLISTDDTLPAEVTCVTRPAAITEVSYLTYFHMNQQWNASVANSGITKKSSGHRQLNLDSGSIIRAGYGDQQALVQPHTLREGEGLGFGVVGARMAGSYNFRILFTDDSGNGYVYEGVMVSTGLEPALAILNGAGSGVILYIQSVLLNEITDTSEPLIDLVPFDDLEDTSLATAVTPVPMDTTNPALPASIVVWQDALIGPRGYKQGALPSVRPGTATAAADPYEFTWRRQMQVSPACIKSQAMSTAWAGSINWGPCGYGKKIFVGRKTGSDITLRPGEGIAIVKRRLGVGKPYQYRIIFTVEYNTDTSRNYPVIGGCHIIRTDHGR